MEKIIVVFLGACLLSGCLLSPIKSKHLEKALPSEYLAVTGRRGYICLYNWKTRKIYTTGVKGDDPALSPDGKKVAFVINFVIEKDYTGNYTGGLYIVNIDGSDKKKVTKSPYIGVMRNPLWFTDGKKILLWADSNLITKKGPAGIYVINADGTDGKCIKKTERNYFDLSPDGGKIISGDSEMGLNGLWLSGLLIMNSDGTDCKLLHGKISPYCVEWSPDGKKIAFDDGLGIYVIDSDGNNLKQIVEHRKGRFGVLSLGLGPWMPDSKKIIYGEGYEAPFLPTIRWSINPDGTGKERFPGFF